MELQLGLSLPITPFSGGVGGGCGSKKSRVVPKTLRLLVWYTNQTNEEDGHPRELHHNSSSSILNNDDEGLVGWPPVKAWRKKLSHSVHNGRANNDRMAAKNSCGGRAPNSTYVKVKLEGNAIARKIDLSVHRSFESLTASLMRMFNISDEHWRESFKLAYQDREGDWLLAEDVPWRTFIRSLKCIKLIRSRC